MMKKLWNDEVGAVVSAELVLVLTILVIGMIVGLAAVRDAVVTELADVAQAIANINQSYSYPAVTGHLSGTAGGLFVDLQDFCDGADATAAQNSKCVTIAAGLANETPTSSEPTSPGPCVTAMALTSDHAAPPSASARSTTPQMSRTCWREASSGTTPPHSR